MTLKEGIECIKDCVQEMQTRFLLSQPKFEMKIVTKDGTKIETIE
jgi:20S proteasome alpha/beta subunit